MAYENECFFRNRQHENLVRIFRPGMANDGLALSRFMDVVDTTISEKSMFTGLLEFK